ncbi:MAG TPA: aspartyl/asparaginyl beta-hydroxylase domain-containing protein [Steroidobacteraceae bacterium]|nr:aspartyl/asparaginyl beta-hydroxylase domain-containing protein [Steroidobacteraceae bacterium]
MNTSQIDDRRIRQLIELSTQAFAGGRTQDADRLLRQAQAEAPRHVTVLNETARRLLLAGNPAGAHQVLAQALEIDPSNSTLRLNLAAALRGLGRSGEEMAAIDQVLAAEPRNVRALLQKGSLQELQGQPRAAAMTFRHTLQMIPPGFEPPQQLKPILQQAKDVVAANDRALEAFLEDRLKDMRARYPGEPLGRFEKCLATMLQKQPIYRQQPSFMYFPGLPAIEFYERSDFPWLDSIEAATADIRAELLGVLADGTEMLQPYVAIGDGVPLDQWKELNHSRRWGVYYLWREGVAFPDHIARCPRTVAALEAWPRCDVPGCGPTAVFSILDAKTRIPPHTGVSNTRLVVHLPLIIPPGCSFRVGAERREWQPGKAFVFDDTMEHEAWNDSDVPRAVLILDIWSPLLSAAERDLVRSLTAGVGEWYGISSYGGV